MPKATSRTELQYDDQLGRGLRRARLAAGVGFREAAKLAGLDISSVWRIEEGQINAENIKKQLAAAQTKYEEILAKANADAQRLLDEVRASGDRLAEQKRQEAITAAEQIAVKAQEAIALERDRIMAELKQELGRLVVDTTTRVTGKVLTPQDHQRINEETARQIAA